MNIYIYQFNMNILLFIFNSCYCEWRTKACIKGICLLLVLFQRTGAEKFPYFCTSIEIYLKLILYNNRKQVKLKQTYISQPLRKMLNINIWNYLKMYLLYFTQLWGNYIIQQSMIICISFQFVGCQSYKQFHRHSTLASFFFYEFTE